MRYIRLSELKIGMADLFTNRLETLQTSVMGRAYEPLLRTKHDEINALPPVLTALPLVDQLASADGTHDAIGAAILAMLEAYQQMPDVAAEVRDAAVRLQGAFIPSRAQLVLSYAEEAANAQARREKLETYASDLQLFPVASGQTLADWATAFVDAGEKMGTLLAERADTDSRADTEQRKRAAALRSETVGLLNQARDAIRKEVVNDPSLPRDLEARIFDYFDTLENMHA